MEKSTVLGKNRTGVDMSPLDAKEMIALAGSTPASSPGDERAIAKMRGQYIAEGGVLGSIPPPATLKGVATTAIKKLTGRNPEAFIDKLGCRLAFERTGVRLYDALIAKCSTGAVGASEIPLDTLWEFRNQELEHFKLVESAIRSIGADPTVQTPSADVAGMAALGLMQILTDPRTSVEQCLEAVLTAELTDNAAWELLIELAAKMGQEDMARDFQGALRHEENHLMHVRQWFRDLTVSDAGVGSYS
jgi:rubrerythrin